MSAMSDFQSEHGQAWGEIVNSPAFGAAMQLLNLEKMTMIAALAPEEIEAKGKLLLADLVGHLNHENNLASLGVRREFVFTEVRETYPDPVGEHAENNQPEPPPKRRKK